MLDWIAITAIATVLLASATVWLGWQTRGATQAAREELEELRAQRRASDAEREQERRRARAMELLTCLVEARSALDDLVNDLEGDQKRPTFPGSMPLPESAWPHFAERWATLGPELTTRLYVADFVPENVRRTARGRMQVLEQVGRRDDLRKIEDMAKNLGATLDQVRESVDAALGLSATQRPL